MGPPMKLVDGVLKPARATGGRVVGRSKPIQAPLSRLKEIAKTQAPRICVTRALGGIGDVLMTTPALAAIKREWPNSHLTYATDFKYLDGALKDILAHNPYIDELISHHIISSRNFDVSYDVSSVCLQYERPGTKPPNRIDLFAQHVGIPLDGIRCLPTYILAPDEITWAKKRFAKMLKRVQKPIYIGIQPRSTTPRRNWPIEKVKELIGLLAQNPAFKVIVFDSDFAGGPTDESKWNFLNVETFINFGIRQITAALNELDLFVCMDSGLLHLAGALNKKIVSIFGSTHPESRINHYPNATAVWRADELHCSGGKDLACWYENCKNHFACLTRITVEDVYNAIMKRIDEPLKEATSSTASNTTIHKPVIRLKRSRGGIGDILCTTCAIRVLKENVPDVLITVEMPPEYHCIFDNHPDIDQCIAYNSKVEMNPYAISSVDFAKADAKEEVESLNKTGKVKKTRPEMYIEAIGGTPTASNTIPQIYLTEEEFNWTKQKIAYEAGLTYITTTLRTADRYRDWPEENYFTLFSLAAKKYPNWRFILTAAQRSDMPFPPNVIDLTGFGIRRMFSAVGISNIVLTPDTSLLHVAAALEKPCVALFGPIDDQARCKHYTKTVIVKDEDRDCMPCWRNANKPCKHASETEDDLSYCMTNIPVDRVLEALEQEAKCIVV